MTFNEDLYRLATKMAAATLVAFDRAQVVAESVIPAYLVGDASIPVSPAYCDIGPVRNLRLPLSHAVYVELGEVSYAIALIFGFLEVYVPLPSVRQSAAFLASLDPMSGDESFQVVMPIGTRTVPQYLFEVPRAHFQEMCDALSREAISRGAKRPPKLELKGLDLGPPADLSALNGTIRYMFPFKREH